MGQDAFAVPRDKLQPSCEISFSDCFFILYQHIKTLTEGPSAQSSQYRDDNEPEDFPTDSQIEYVETEQGH